jgi:hypothetical protein
MTDQERKALAESLHANPLFHALFAELEASATQACIWATDEDTRRAAAMRVQAIQTLRQDCEEALRSKPASKGAPA